MCYTFFGTPEKFKLFKITNCTTTIYTIWLQTNTCSELSFVSEFSSLSIVNIDNDGYEWKIYIE